MSDRGTGTPGATAGATRTAAPPAAPVQIRMAAPGGSVIGGATDRGGNVRGVLPGETSTPLPNIPGAGTTDAQAQLREVLDQWGLGGLLSWAWEKLTTGASAAQIIYELRQTAEYKTRFAGNVARQAAGLTPLSEAEYLGYESQARQMYAYYGFPKGFYDQPDDFTSFIARDWSISELNDTLAASVKLAQSDVATQGAFGRLYFQDATGTPRSYSVGDLAAYYLDDTRALPVLERQFQAASIAGAGTRTGFGEIDRITAEHLASLGVSPEQAGAGFGQLALMREVTGQIIGDTGPGMSQADQVSAVFDRNATTQTELSRRQRARQSAFEQGTTRFAETRAR